jgi:hypothetical protein
MKKQKKLRERLSKKQAALRSAKILEKARIRALPKVIEKGGGKR